MNNTLSKIKRLFIFFFAGIGALALLWIIFNSFLVAQYSSTGGLGVGRIQTRQPAVFSDIGVPQAATLKIAEEAAAPAPRSLSEGSLTQRKIIKNGSLSLLVKNAEESAASIKGIAERLNGFVANSQIYETAPIIIPQRKSKIGIAPPPSNGGGKSGSVTIRVPADRFDEAMGALKKLAVKVEQESVSTSDVTEQFIDLEAQLKNLRAEETQYLEIMKRAQTVKDTLEVASRLSNVRGRIEGVQGQLQYLSRQIDMSTITASLTEEEDVTILGIRWRPLLVIKQSFRNLLEGLTGFINAFIRFVFYLPILVLWASLITAVAVIGWRVFRWLRRRFFSTGGGIA